MKVTLQVRNLAGAEMSVPLGFDLLATMIRSMADEASMCGIW
jgi:hypothetical protein